MKSLQQTFSELNRNVRILGSAAILILGGLGAWLVLRPARTVVTVAETSLLQTLRNEYFTKLVASGAAEAEALRRLAAVLPYGKGYIGVTSERMDLPEARVLAERMGADVLDVAAVALERKSELCGWMAASFPERHGTSSWVFDDGAPAAIDAPDLLRVRRHHGEDGVQGPAPEPETARFVFLAWPPRSTTGIREWSWVIAPEYDDVTPFSPWGLARVRKGNQWGLVDHLGRTVLAPGFDEITEFDPDYGSARLRKGNRWGVVDRDGKLVTPPQWQNVQELIRGFLPVQQGGKWGYTDGHGKLVIPCEWDDAWRFSHEGFAVVTRHGKRGIIDRAGALVVPPAWDGAVNFTAEGLGLVMRKGPRGSPVGDPAGNRGVRNQATDVRGWALVHSGGRVLTKPEWSFGQYRRQELQTGLIRASKPAGGKDVLFNLGGQLVGEVEPGEVGGRESADPPAAADLPGNSRAGGPHSMASDLVPHVVPPKVGLINAKGEIVKEIGWDDAEIVSSSLVKFQQGQQWGLADGAGKQLIAAEWDRLRVLPVGTGSLSADGRTILLTQAAGARKILSPWVEATRGGQTTILRVDGTRGLPESMSGATYVDFYGENRLAIREPDGKGGTVWSLYEPGTGKQVRFPMAKTFRWNWNSAAAGFLWVQDRDSLAWKLMTADGRDLGHSQPEEEKPEGWGFIDGLAPLHLKDGWTYIRPDASPAFADRWDAARSFSEGRAAVCRKGKWTFITTKGQAIVPPQWDEVHDFRQGLAGIRLGDRWGFADLTGKVVLSPVWDSVESSGFNGDYEPGFFPWCGDPDESGIPQIDVARVTLKGMTALINRRGELLIDPASRRLETKYGEPLYRDGVQIMVAASGGQPQVMQRTWAAGGLSAYDWFDEISPGRGWAERRSGGFDLVDGAGRRLSTGTWERPSVRQRLDVYAPQLILASSPDGLYGLLDRKGAVVLPPEFNELLWIAPGVALVWSEHDGGLINAAGQWLFRDSAQRRVARITDTYPRRPGDPARTDYLRRMVVRIERWTSSWTFTEPAESYSEEVLRDPANRPFRHGLAIIEQTPRYGYARWKH
jgi:hypothetical protein